LAIGAYSRTADGAGLRSFPEGKTSEYLEITAESNSLVSSLSFVVDSLLGKVSIELGGFGDIDCLKGDSSASDIGEDEMTIGLIKEHPGGSGFSIHAENLSPLGVPGALRALRSPFSCVTCF
jgi:hypothetical protein